MNGVSGENLVLVVDELLHDNPHALVCWMTLRKPISESREMSLEEADTFMASLENCVAWMDAGRPSDPLIVNLAEV